MDCDSLLLYLGAELADSSNSYSLEDNYALTAIGKIVSLVFFLYIMILFMFLRIRRKEKIKKMIEDSIFSFLDDLNDSKKVSKEDLKKKEMPDSSPTDNYLFEELRDNNFVMNYRSETAGKIIPTYSFYQNEINLLNKEIENSFKQKDIIMKPKYNQETYICNFEENCCICLCDIWYINIYQNIIKRKYKHFSEKFVHCYYRNLKPFCFYVIMLGTFLFNPLRNFVSVFFNSCNDYTLSSYNSSTINIVFGFLDLICGSFALVLYIFLISFLSTQAEFKKIYLFDKTYRARLIHFHLKKAFIFGILHFIWKFLYKLSIGYDFPFDNENNPGSVVWLLFKNCFFLFSIKIYHKSFWVSIERDCRNLQAQSNYFIIQNNLIKSIPQADKIYLMIKKIIWKESEKKREEQFIIEPFAYNKKDNGLKDSQFNNMSTEASILEEILDKTYCKLNENIKDELKIINNQCFKNIIRNHGIRAIIPNILIISLLIMSFFLLISLSISLVSLLSKNLDYLNKISNTACLLIKFFEYSILPFLMYYSLKKKTYFSSQRKNY